jgi:3-dehydroquinate dehydratase II
MANVLVMNGPNLDALGTREPAIYGTDTLSAIVGRLASLAKSSGHAVEAFQTDSEREFVQRAKTCGDHADFVLLNPAGFTHTSVPLRDAMALSGVPFIEVHLSNPHAREPFRHRSLFSDLAVGVVAGFGAQSYELALEAAIRWISAK